MLQQLLHTIIISCICIAWGVPAYALLIKGNAEAEKHFGGPFRLITVFFAGLLTLSLLSSWAMLFTPLQFKYLLIATGILVIFSFFFRARFQSIISFPKLSLGRYSIVLVFGIVCILLFLFLGALKPVNLDTHIYHLQIIRWTNEYGAVPGIANIYPRFGLGSNWFNLVSAFYIPAFSHQNFTFLNTTICIWFLLWLLSKWQVHFVNGKENKRHQAFAFFYFLLITYFLYDWQLFRDTANSTSYDFVVTALTLMVISYLAESLFINQPRAYSFFFVVLVISIIPFKLSGIFVLILLFIYLLQYKHAKHWIMAIIAGIVIISPLLIKNYITTGYPLYPMSIGIGNPGWQLPLEMTRKMNDYIMTGNKFYNYTTSFADQQNLTTFNWIPFWINGILLRHKIILLLALLSVFLFFYNPAKEISHKRINILMASIWLMIAGWFFTAPDPRFAFAIILFLAFFPVCLLFGSYVNKKIYQSLLLVFTIAILAYGIIKARDKVDMGIVLHCQSVDQPEYKTESRNGIEIHNTRINNNWLCPCIFTLLPCMGEDNPYVKPRTEMISDGFYMDPIPDSTFIRNYNY